jgi:hypothetical protein
MPVIATLHVLINVEDPEAAAEHLSNIMKRPVARGVVIDWEYPPGARRGDRDLCGSVVDVPEHLLEERPRGYLRDLADRTRRH